MTLVEEDYEGKSNKSNSNTSGKYGLIRQKDSSRDNNGRRESKGGNRTEEMRVTLLRFYCLISLVVDATVLRSGRPGFDSRLRLGLFFSG